MDLMSQQGVLPMIGSLIQSGVQTPWGSINADVNTAITKLKLPTEKQAVAREIAQIIYEQNQPIMKQGKAISFRLFSTEAKRNISDREQYSELHLTVAISLIEYLNNFGTLLSYFNPEGFK
jgi:hypothetical protein